MSVSGGNPASPSTVLVVGDWILDSYVRLVEQNQDKSGHIGRTHYRIVPPISREIRGAGYIARILSTIQHAATKPRYSVIGLGGWNAEDTTLLQHFLHLEDPHSCDVRRSSSTAYICHCPGETDPLPIFSLLPDFATIQITRLYHSRGQVLEQIGRIDQEPEPHDRSAVQAVPHKTELVWPDETAIPSESVKAIVVDDRQKGMFLGTAVIDALVERYSKAKWYVRAKSATLSWLSRLPAERLELLVLGPEVLPLINPYDRWLEGNRSTSHAIQLLEDMPDCVRVLLTSNCEAIVLTAPRGGAQHIVMGRYTNYLKAPLGWAGGFFATLVNDMLTDQWNGSASTDPDPKVVVEQLRDMLSSVLSRSSRLHGFPLLEPGPKRALTSPPTVNCQLFAEANGEWLSAKSEEGFITRQSKGGDSELQLQLWRSCVHLAGYVSWITQKQQSLLNIGRVLRSFRKKAPVRSVNVLLEASSGSGKTTLALNLAKAFDFAFVEADVSAMVRREELLYVFDSIANRQAVSDKPVLVFVDEVNARLEGDHVYSAFLMPIESGFYNRQGSRISLKPCVWIFAGTDVSSPPPQHDNLPQEPRDPKLEDFLQRMTMTMNLDYKHLRKELGNNSAAKARLQLQAQLEQVYFGAYMIKYFWPDVEYVSDVVLQQFADEPVDGAPFRAIRKLASELQNVRHGIVTEANALHIDSEGSARAAVADIPAERMVRLVMRPDD
jgi:hypothetical protein